MWRKGFWQSPKMHLDAAKQSHHTDFMPEVSQSAAAAGLLL
eukprot:CAMPEP_0172858688 /NCGR_PEP_ID=MMETSP1075-20121228/67611_1 /TAXON_ID=2916 /ORGANISM="Ceratium fusus, Strain PA161109" /LENGTH=40 /DNA_ID= /DNA_START= /DNA_END= /DNA_ORIENTATION=